MNSYILLSDSYKPRNNSGAIITGDLARELTRIGHKITVVTFLEDMNPEYSDCQENGIRVIRIKIGDRKTSRVHRALIEMSFSRRIIATLKTLDDLAYDGIICYAPSIFFGRAVQWLKKRKRVKAYLIIRDIFPKWAVDSGLIKKGLIYQYFKYIERSLYKSVDTIGIESSSDLGYFNKELRGKNKGIEVLNTWGSTIKIADSGQGKEVFDPEKVNILYGGNLGDAQDILSLVELIDPASLGDRAILTLLGDGDQLPVIRKKVAALNTNNIVILPPVEHSKYLSILSASDIGLVSLNKNLKGNNHPLKMIGYMQMGKPILAAVNRGNDIVRLIQDNDIGMASTADDKKELNENLVAMVNDEALRKRQGQNARDLFLSQDRKSVV